MSKYLLERVPEHLRERVWMVVPHASRKIDALGARRYIAVYERPYDACIDHEHLAIVLNGYVRISTKGMMSLDWRQALQYAIQGMEYIGGKRKAA